MEGLGSLLRAIRKSKGISAREMAALVRVPTVTYWRAEKGNATMLPTAWMIVGRLSRWKLPEDQAEKLQSLKERILQ